MPSLDTLHRHLRLIAVLAIALSVSFVSGSFILADSMKATFDNLFGQLTQDVDPEVRTELTVDQINATRDPVPAELVDEDYDDVTDGAVIWFREDDGDLTDALVDATSALILTTLHARALGTPRVAAVPARRCCPGRRRCSSDRDTGLRGAAP